MYLLAKVLQSRAIRMEADERGKSHNPLHASSKSFQSRRAHPPRHDQAKKSANQKQKRRWCGVGAEKCNPPPHPRHELLNSIDFRLLCSQVLIGLSIPFCIDHQVLGVTCPSSGSHLNRKQFSKLLSAHKKQATPRNTNQCLFYVCAQVLNKRMKKKTGIPTSFYYVLHRKNAIVPMTRGRAASWM